MAVSPFTFFRGSAGLMAHDLGSGPATPLRVELCGDCHLANFGLYATPERTLIFDLNDFDEAASGPFEWDIKRLATSAVLAARQNGHDADQARHAGEAVGRGYRTAAARFAAEGPLATWYRKVPADDLVAGAARLGPRAAKVVGQAVEKARRRTSARLVPRLTERVDGRLRFVERPAIDVSTEDVLAFIRTSLSSYRRSLAPEIRTLFDRYDVVDVTRRVVGVGSVGLEAWVLLLEHDDEIVVLQLKEARASVLEEHCGAPRFRNAGQRVVVGQRTLQAASDVFLGWLRTPGGVDFYVRQLHDMKGAIPLESLEPAGLVAYAELCGAVLARAHACSADMVPISSYLGGSTVFDEAIGAYATAYADLTGRDFERFVEARAAGVLA